MGPAAPLKEHEFLQIARLAIENTSDGILWLDSQGTIVYVNPALCGLLDYSREELVSESLWKISEDFSEETWRSLRERVRDHAAETFETRYRNRHGTVFPVEVLAVELNLSDRIYYVLCVRNISERKKELEAMLRAARLEATSTLAGGIAHDFNNLMARVLGYSEILREELQNDSRATEMLTLISDGAREASRLAERLLAYARGGRYQKTKTDLNQVVEDVIKVKNRDLPRMVRILRDLDPDLREVIADPTQLSLVVVELLANSIEAVGEEGFILISTKNIDSGPENQEEYGLDPGRYVRVSVRDTGHGMDEAVQSRVFEPFFTTRFPGRGLGLAAAYGIIREHGGKIMTRSRPGKGAEVAFFLPAAPEVHLRPEEQESLEGGSETILIVEDDKTVRDVFAKMLRLLGYRVLTARDGSEAVKVVHGYTGEIHLTVLDLDIPEISAPDCFSILKSNRPRMKFLLCSGYDRDRIAEKLLAEGAGGFLPKPVSQDQLGKAVRRVLDER